MPKIDDKEKAIRDVFHRDYAFSIPAYQRPYSLFQITSRVLKEDEWTPAVFAKHQAETVAKLKEVWGL